MRRSLKAFSAKWWCLAAMATFSALILLKSVTLRHSVKNHLQPQGFASTESNGLTLASQARNTLAKGYAKLPLRFEVNHGQANDQVRFLVHGGGYALFLTTREAMFCAAPHRSKINQPMRGFDNRPAPLSRYGLLAPNSLYDPTSGLLDAVQIDDGRSIARMQFVGANPAAEVTGIEELPGKSNYFIGNDPHNWRTNIPSYAGVRYKGVYPGVDLIYYGSENKLECDFVIAPVADPGVIELRVGSARAGFTGMRSQAGTRVEANGEVMVSLGSGELRLHKPVVYQLCDEIGSRYQLPTIARYARKRASMTQSEGETDRDCTTEHRLVEGHWVLKGKNLIGFELAKYDRTKPLIIDPVLSYSTYLGEDRNDEAYGIAVDHEGNAFVTGFTASADFPGSNALQPNFAGGFRDAFVAKLNATGSAVVYSTYLGGSGDDRAYGIAVDSSDSAYVTGTTSSGNFPVVDALQSSNQGGFDAFVAKLNAAGSALVYSTYLGGSGDDRALGIAVDSSGQAHVAGYTGSNDFPTGNPLQTKNHGGFRDAFVTKLNAAGSAAVYSTYLGGSSFDEATGIALDLLGSAYVTGYTGSNDFPMMSALQPKNHGGFTDAFVAKLNPAGSDLVYSTYLGGGGDDYAYGIAVDRSGSAYVVGNSGSGDFPTVNPLPGSNRGGVFVSKLNGTGSALVYSTHVGNGVGYGIAVDLAGNAHITGTTGSTDFPVVNPIQAVNHGLFLDAFVSELNAASSALIFSTYLGGHGDEYPYGICTDSFGNTYLTGSTTSSDFPILNPLQDSKRGSSDVFVVKIASTAAAGSSQHGQGPEPKHEAQ